MCVLSIARCVHGFDDVCLVAAGGGVGAHAATGPEEQGPRAVPVSAHGQGRGV